MDFVASCVCIKIYTQFLAANGQKFVCSVFSLPRRVNKHSQLSNRNRIKISRLALSFLQFNPIGALFRKSIEFLVVMLEQKGTKQNRSVHRLCAVFSAKSGLDIAAVPTDDATDRDIQYGAQWPVCRS